MKMTMMINIIINERKIIKIRIEMIINMIKIIIEKEDIHIINQRENILTITMMTNIMKININLPN